MFKTYEISSGQNNKIKLLNKLKLKKYRSKENLFTVENLTIVYDALKSGFDFREVYVTPEFVERNKTKFEFIKNNSHSKSCFFIADKLNKTISQLDTPSGIVAVYEVPTKKLNSKSSVLYLNGIKDPGNMGSILRAAIAFDVVNIVVDETCVDVYNLKAIHAAKDAIFKVNIFNDQNFEWVKRNKPKLDLIVANANKGVDAAKVKIKSRFCLVLGSESHGVDPEFVELAHQNVKIKISKNIESLNVSQAAAILLYELAKF